jgi:hypothetical protein
MSVHRKAITVTRAIIAILMMVAIWTSPGAISGVAATIGTVMWLFLTDIVKYEERLYRRYMK